MPRWVDLGQNAPQMVDKLLDLNATPAEVKRHASLMTAQLQDAWDRRIRARAMGRHRQSATRTRICEHTFGVDVCHL